MNYNLGMPIAAPLVPPVTDGAELASHVSLSVFRLARKLKRESAPEITPTLLAALSTIDRHGSMTAGALATHEQIQKPTCTRVIADLLALGFIDRVPDPVDGRVAWVRATTSGPLSPTDRGGRGTATPAPAARHHRTFHPGYACLIRRAKKAPRLSAAINSAWMRRGTAYRYTPPSRNSISS